MFSLSDGGALLITTAKYAPSAGKPFMEEPINPTVKVDRPVEAEVILPDGDDDDDTDAEKPEQQVTQPPKPAPPVEDIQLKKALEIVKQITTKAQAAKRAANLRAPQSVPAFRDPGLST